MPWRLLPINSTPSTADELSGTPSGCRLLFRCDAFPLPPIGSPWGLQLLRLLIAALPWLRHYSP
jgi:hypothetical protein